MTRGVPGAPTSQQIAVIVSELLDSLVSSTWSFASAVAVSSPRPHPLANVCDADAPAASPSNGTNSDTLN